MEPALAAARESLRLDITKWLELATPRITVCIDYAENAKFRPLVRAALETGCRYSELTRLEVHDFNDRATEHIA
jgi:integrase